MKPPNYRKTSGSSRCFNCGAFVRKDDSTGRCLMYSVTVRRNFVCNRWYARP